MKAPPYPLQDFKALYKCCIIIIIKGIWQMGREDWSLQNYGLDLPMHTPVMDTGPFILGVWLAILSTRPAGLRAPTRGES